MSSNSYFNTLFDMATLLNDAELRALTDKCQNLIADRERIKREELRQELMGNLQKAIDDILHNGFAVTVENTELNLDETDYAAVYLEPEDTYSIKIE